MKSIDNRVTRLFGIKYPIISGGMVWCSGAKLAAAVSNAGGLGLIGAGSLKPDMLREHIIKCRELTKEPFGVNVPLMSPYSKDQMAVIIEEKVPIVFTSAGNPQLWTETLHQHGIKVAHVVSSSKFALKAQQAGVDAVVAEGFEAIGVACNVLDKESLENARNIINEKIGTCDILINGAGGNHPNGNTTKEKFKGIGFCFAHREQRKKSHPRGDVVPILPLTMYFCRHRSVLRSLQLRPS